MHLFKVIVPHVAWLFSFPGPAVTLKEPNVVTEGYFRCSDTKLLCVCSLLPRHAEQIGERWRDSDSSCWLPFQQPSPLRHDRHHHQGGWLREDRLWKGQRGKMGAASLHHPHPLTEMLNLSSLDAGSPLCTQMVRATHCRPCSLKRGRAHIPERLRHQAVLRAIHDNTRSISEI